MRTLTLITISLAGISAYADHDSQPWPRPGNTVTLECASEINSGRVYCKSPIADPLSVILKIRISLWSCIEGKNWGYSYPGTVWTEGGCSGIFEITPRPIPILPPSPIPLPPEVSVQIRCGKDANFHHVPCSAPGIARITKVDFWKQKSNSACIPGERTIWTPGVVWPAPTESTWGVTPDAAQVWIDRGCDGIFDVHGYATR